MLSDVMSYQRGGSGRRYSLLEVSGGAGRCRPRSSSISVVDVATPSPSYGRPPPTPCYNPCYVSPRMAFNTQLSYDSPIQILTCAGASGSCLAPRVVNTLKRQRLWKIVLLAVLLFLLTISLGSFMSTSGGEQRTTEDTGKVTDQDCSYSDHDDNPACSRGSPDHAHHHTSLQRLRYTWSTSPPEQPATDQQEGPSEEEDFDYVDENGKRPPETEDGITLEQRPRRTRTLTFHGQYEEESDQREFNLKHTGVVESVKPQVVELEFDHPTTPESGEKVLYYPAGDYLPPTAEVASSERGSAQQQPQQQQQQQQQYDHNDEQQQQQPRSATEDSPSVKSSPSYMDNPQSLPSQDYLYNGESPYPHNQELGNLERLQIQHEHLKQGQYQREQQIVEQQIAHQLMMKQMHHQKLWQEQRRRQHDGEAQHRGRDRPSQRSFNSEANRVEFGGSREQHWHQQAGRLPRGVNPRIYGHEEF